VRCFALHLIKRNLAGAHGAGVHAFTVAVESDQLGDVGLVLNDQDRWLCHGGIALL
ncbi:MAG: hypothetical protein RIR77_1793, partial [Planctomycetota bacterium]